MFYGLVTRGISNLLYLYIYIYQWSIFGHIQLIGQYNNPYKVGPKVSYKWDEMGPHMSRVIYFTPVTRLFSAIYRDEITTPLS